MQYGDLSHTVLVNKIKGPKFGTRDKTLDFTRFHSLHKGFIDKGFNV